MIRTLSVYSKDSSLDSKGKDLLSDAHEFLKTKSITAIHVVRRYYLEGVSEEDFQALRDNLLVESVWQESVADGDFYEELPHRVEVAYKPGMMNPEMRSLKEAAEALGIKSLQAADSSWIYVFDGEPLDVNEVEAVISRLVMNPLIEEIRTHAPETLLIQDRPGVITLIPIREMSEGELLVLSRDTLFLTLHEMQTIQNYFRTLGRDPYDAELEALAQTWSEHCCHKTFKAKLTIDGIEKTPLFKRLKESTKKINHPLVVSCFEDNSGVFKLNEAYGICAKVETHNSPSALDPFGGAGTGVGGCYRDIVGTGQGAKVIAGTDIFCVGPPDLPEEEVPQGCKHPRFILKGLVRGVGDYGNPMGVPTVNGSIHFHPDFTAKPSVIVGAYGLIPLERAQKGEPRKGDLILILGGKTGRDGVHGATFSSAEMTESTEKVNAAAVQIGDPIEEQRMFQAILEIGGQGLIRAMTDCGAGGFSSAIGEMAKDSGARVYLERAPLKYRGLQPWEIWLSESQERMVLAIDPENKEAVEAILKKHHVEGTVLGEFTDDQRLFITYEGQTLCDLPMEFLHNGLDQLDLVGTTERVSFKEPSEDLLAQANYNNALQQVLSHPNVCSKEPIIRRYDHNIQGTAVQMPLVGQTHGGPNNASVLEPLPGMKSGVVIGHGLNPILNRIDPYLGSQWAIYEAVANVIAQGADPAAIALVDNFIWPKPDEKFIADLSHSVDACVDTANTLKMPFISGKDSLSSTYRRGETVIHIPPVLCVSAMGMIQDISETISSCLKKAGNTILLIGKTQPEMGGSIYYDTLGWVGNNLASLDPAVALKTFQCVHEGIQKGLILSCQDVSEGGMVAMVAEMAFGNKMGASLEKNNGELKPYEWLFSESPGRFVVEVAPENIEALKALCGEIACEIIGEVTSEGNLKVRDANQMLVDIEMNQLHSAWQAPMKKIFG